MPADRLSPARQDGSRLSQDTDAVVRAVLQVLAGKSLEQVAALHHLDSAELCAAAEVFCQAGGRALYQQSASGWKQVYIEFADWTTADGIAAAHLAPLLQQVEAEDPSAAWWFIRKHPCWRLRLHTAAEGLSARSRLTASLDGLASAGLIRRWWRGVYEPEAAAFGGRAGMAVGHRLFHADSRAVLMLAGQEPTALGLRELSVLLLATLLRAAGLEWYEQGDVWHLVSRERPLPADVPPGRLEPMTADIRALLLADTSPDGPLFGQGRPAASATRWADAFRTAGWELGAAAREGRLERGLRNVIAYHTIFHWNRLGLSSRTQSLLAWTAREAVLGPVPASADQHLGRAE